MSQSDDILDRLIDGEVLTPLFALRHCSCLSLSQRCGELRRRGYDHEHHVVGVWTPGPPYAHRKRCGVYYMTRDQRRAARALRRQRRAA